MRVAALFQLVMVPVKSLLMMASSQESTIAASSSSGCSEMLAISFMGTISDLLLTIIWLQGLSSRQTYWNRYLVRCRIPIPLVVAICRSLAQKPASSIIPLGKRREERHCRLYSSRQEYKQT